MRKYRRRLIRKHMRHCCSVISHEQINFRSESWQTKNRWHETWREILWIKGLIANADTCSEDTWYYKLEEAVSAGVIDGN